MKTEWHRVTRQRKCAVCGKGDWCTFTETGACCMRVESSKPMANGGWWHPHDEPKREYVPPPVEPEPPEIHPLLFWKLARKQTKPSQIIQHAEQLGVNPVALDAIGAAWSEAKQAWAFPMLDGAGRVIGIRFRSVHGDKWALRGSRAGLFYANSFDKKPTLYICEGPTDTAAALSAGLCAVGRPSCSGSEQYVLELVYRVKAARVVICPDTDAPGLSGANRLQEKLPVPSVMYMCPRKDIREAVRDGLTKQQIQASINNLVWAQPNERGER